MSLEPHMSAPPAPDPVLILDTGSIYFSAIESVLRRRGCPVARLDVDPQHCDRALGQLPPGGPAVILLGAWLHALLDGPGRTALLATPGYRSLLVVHEGPTVDKGASLAARLTRRERLIDCTTAELNALLADPGWPDPIGTMGGYPQPPAAPVADYGTS